MEKVLLFGAFILSGVVGAVVGYQAGAFIGRQVDARGGQYVEDTFGAVGGAIGFALGLYVAGTLLEI